MAQQIDPDQYTSIFAVTKTTHRDPYPAILPSNPSNSQKGKIIIITGASAGIGAAAAKVWARAGATGVVLAARSPEKLNKVAIEVKNLNPDTKVLAVKADIANEEDVKNLYSAIQKEFGRPADVLLNNAAVLQDEEKIGDTAPEQWWKTIDVNLKGTYSVTHHFIQSQPNPKEPVGTIIFNGSGRAGFTMEGGSSYNIAKIAGQRLCEHLQLEYPTLRVFTTIPGIVLTPMTGEAWKPFAKDHEDLTGMLALYLTQERADFLKGGLVSVNWDVEELEEFREKIEKEKTFKAAWLPVLPMEGGKGLVV